VRDLSSANVDQRSASPNITGDRRFRPLGARMLYVVPGSALALGLLVTLVLTLLTHSVYEHNQQHLLKLRIRDAGALVTAALPSLQTPLASAAELADATEGNVGKFKSFIAPYVGTHGEFVSASLWKLGSPGKPVAVVGLAPRLPTAGVEGPAFFAHASRSSTLDVIGLLNASAPRLGYAFTTPGASTGYAAYAEAGLPADRRSSLQSTSSFAGLNYAIWLNHRRPQDLLVSNRTRLPLPGATDTESITFGNAALILAMSSQTSLAGSLPRDLPWIIALSGTAISLITAIGVLLLTERRRRAEQLAAELGESATEIERLYAEQRTIAQTLQHALLPATLPTVGELQASGRYEAGESNIDIGGDWYDVIELSDDRVLLVVGDVSGRGLHAATTMAALRFAIHAYAAQRDSPTTILCKLSSLLSVARERQLATVLCAQIDVKQRQVCLSSAGHLPPLLLSEEGARYLETEVGLPIGVEVGTSYESTTTEVPPGSTLLAFTDGLVEQRGEHLDTGLGRLRDAAAHGNGGLPQLLSKLVADLSGGKSQDDIAIVGVRWTN
jgi:serine phosphatase RsbU (regulator of sigma subunit)